MNKRFIREKADELKSRIIDLNLQELDVKDYFRAYLKSYQDDFEAIIHRYVDILTQSTRLFRNPKFAFLDYGGGTGILCLLAKLCGIEKVCYLDISEEATQGAQALATALNIPIDEFYISTYEKISDRIAARFDVIANYDVLEHLSSPQEAFSEIGKLLKNNGSIYMASGANTYHPVINILMRREHKMLETRGMGHSQGVQAKKSWVSVREKIIKEKFPYLESREIEKLAILTRGLIRADIIKAVQVYQDNGIFPKPKDSTNTCDPKSGLWNENLIPYFAFAKHLRKRFPEVNVSAGYYPEVTPRFIPAPGVMADSIIKKVYPYLRYVSKVIAPFLNKLIRNLPGPLPFTIAPYYVVEVRRGE
ncbi:MAG: class I SAM-dependent methyltransferase [Candidatus Cloacimonetes bacterium]|nr:class I SAM-dependent methyltransferase [Candidatus Cloacimonadota bacterium]